MKITNISILLTTYNSEKYLRTSIKSVLKQTYKNFEFVIIDDGSNDYTQKVIKSFLDNRIRYHKIEHVGRSKALNYGLKKCRYNWIALVDADDLWAKKKLEMQLNSRINSYRDVIVSDAIFFKDHRTKYLIELPRTQEELKRKFILHGQISGSVVVYNKNLINEAGGYDESLYTAEDYELWLRLFSRINFIIVPLPLVYCHLTKNSLSRGNIKLRNEQVRNIQKKYYKEIVEHFKIPQSEEMNLLAWQEFFYGDLICARKYWLNLGIRKLGNPRILIAFLLTFINSTFVYHFKELRIKYRIKQLFNTHSRILTNELKSLSN